jgi:hypothetical protein
LGLSSHVWSCTSYNMLPYINLYAVIASNSEAISWQRGGCFAYGSQRHIL